MNDLILQWQYENICDNLGLSSYIDLGDQVNDIREQSLGDILEIITLKIKHIEEGS